MNVPSKDELLDGLKAARISRRLVRDLRYVPEEITHVESRDFLAVLTKSRNEGAILYDGVVAPFQVSARRPNGSGRVESVICDICATWQRGTASATLTLVRSATRTSTFLICADLECSLHVRGMTQASTLSKAQLREHISPEGRIARLRQRLTSIVQG